MLLYLNKDVNNQEERCWMRRSLTGIRLRFDELANALLSPNQLSTTAQFSSCLNGGDLAVTARATLIYPTPKADVLGFYKSFV